MLEVQAQVSSGRGGFTPRFPKGRGGHIVVLGGAVANSNTMVVNSLLEEVCHPKLEPCDVVTMAKRAPSQVRGEET